jgi:glucose-6-phosphate dehydrogenase assembly protein OpcA
VSAPAWATLAKVASLDAVDSTLARAWESAGARGAAETRVRSMNVLAICERLDHVARADEALATVAAKHGARTVRVTFDDAIDGSLAEIALHPREGVDLPAGERVVLAVGGAASEHVDDVLARLTVPDLPSYVWWVGDLPDNDDRFARIAHWADLAVFDSSEMDLRDLPVLLGFATRQHCACDVADLGWYRLRTWQDMIARFFDEPTALAKLPTLASIEVRFTQRTVAPEPLSNEAALLVGWLTHRLGFAFTGWSDGGSAREARFRGPNGDLGVRFVEDATRYAVDRREPRWAIGAIDKVTLRCDGASYSVTRAEEDAEVLCWSADLDDGSFPTQCVRAPTPSEARALSHRLGRRNDDALLVASLRRAVELVAPIAPPAPPATLEPR